MRELFYVQLYISRSLTILSCALQYIMLHLSGYEVSMDDLKGFRQVDSITPGHPELGVTDGIEVTTGPLGQGMDLLRFISLF